MNMPHRNGVLNLGCGSRKIDGAVNVDISTRVGADLVHDLSVLSRPLPSSAFHEVHAQDVIEHIADERRWGWTCPAWFLSIELKARK